MAPVPNRSTCRNLLIGLLAYVGGLAYASNSTVLDDTDPTITYHGDSWHPFNSSYPSNLGAQPNPSQVHNGTWHDGSLTSDAVSPVLLDFPFTGTGLTVYCILWHLQSGITPYQNGSITSLSFTIDGQPAGNYTSGPYTSYASTTYDYNVPVYNSTSISNGQHTFSMALQPNTVAFFDYAVVYQTEQPVKKKAPVGAIVGSIIGVLLLFVVLSLIIRCLVRRRRRRDMTFDIDDGDLSDPTISIHGGPVSSHHQTPLEPYVLPNGHTRELNSVERIPKPNLRRGDINSPPVMVEVEEDAEDARRTPIRLPPPYKDRPKVDNKLPQSR